MPAAYIYANNHQMGDMLNDTPYGVEVDDDDDEDVDTIAMPPTKIVGVEIELYVLPCFNILNKCRKHFLQSTNKFAVIFKESINNTFKNL